MMKGIIKLIGERFKRAKQAFHDELEVHSDTQNLVDEGQLLRKQKMTAGWLIPVDSEVLQTPMMQSLELQYGDNFLDPMVPLVSDPSEFSRDSEDVKSTVRLLVTSGKIILSQPGKARKSYFHGDEIELEGQRFRVCLLSARAYVKWYQKTLHSLLIPLGVGALLWSSLNGLWIISTVSLSHAQNLSQVKKVASGVTQSNSEKKEIETIEISSSDLIRAPFDSTFTMEVAIPGLTHVDAKKVKPYVRAQGERHLLELESYQKRRSNYVIIGFVVFFFNTFDNRRG